MSDRPLGITILAVLNVIGGVVALIGVVSLLGDTRSVNVPDNYQFTVNFLLFFSVLLSIGAIVVGVGLWRLSRWAWQLTVALYILNIASSACQLVMGGRALAQVGGIVINILILIYMNSENVRYAFGRNSNPGDPPLRF